MICEKAMELMSAELDGELTEQEQQELKAHLDRCEDCRRLHEAMRSIDEKVSALETPTPEGLKRGVMYRIDQESGKVKPARRRFFGIGTGLGIAAAALVLMVGAGLIRLPSLRGGSSSAPKSNDPMTALSTSSLIGFYAEHAEAAPGEPEPAYQNSDTHVKSHSFGDLFPSETKADAREDTLTPAETRAPANEIDTAPEATWAAETMAPDQTNSYSYGSSLFPGELDDAQRAAFGSLALEKESPILFYSEFSYDSLLDLLQAEAPDLGGRLADCTLSEEQGLICCETDWETALALQEWLLAVCPRSEEVETSEKTRLTERMEVLDPGSEILYRVITFRDGAPALLSEEAFPAQWPEGWSRRLLAAENWALVFPEEDLVPRDKDAAWLIFPAD